MLKLATKFIPVPQAFETAHRSGFRNVELWLDAAVLAGWETIVPLAREYPFEYVLHFPNRTDLSPESLDHCVELYRALDCRCMVIHQPMFDKYAADLASRNPGLQCAVENHTLTPDKFTRWAVENEHLTLDVEHLWMLTLRDAPRQQLIEATRDFLKQFGSKLRHVHLPGYNPGFDEHRPMYCSREMVFAVLSLLEEHQFEGLIVSETSPEFQNADELRMDVLLFEAWRAQRALSSST